MLTLTRHKNNVGTCIDRRNTCAIYNNLQLSQFYQQRQENCRLKSTQFKTMARQAQETITSIDQAVLIRAKIP